MSWKTHFDALGDGIVAAARRDERLSLWFQAEDSDFVRFNHGRVRQAGEVHTGEATVRLVVGSRHATAEVTVTGDLVEDRRRIDTQLEQLRAMLPLLPEDPHLLLPATVISTDTDDGGTQPDARAATRAVVEAAAEHGLDLVGFYEGGASHRGYRDSAGQRNWFTCHDHALDWCLVHATDKAVKQSIAGKDWNESVFLVALERGRRDLVALGRPPIRLDPGARRAWLTPDAMCRLSSVLSNSGFSARAQLEQRSSLQRLVRGEAALDPRVSISENLGLGLSPRFTSDGFVLPERVPLVREGRHGGALAGARTAAEHAVPINGFGHESTVALDMAPGDLPTEAARAALGTGVWVSQLWYCNYSDRDAARITGMTRFATLWVEDGEVVAPIEVMRFDDTVYGLLGERLEALGAEAELVLTTSTRGFRTTYAARVPGALVSELVFTL